MDAWTKLSQGMSDFGLTPSSLVVEKFQSYYEQLVEKNKVMNLTAITKEEEVVEKHFLDSLAILHFFDLNNAKKVIDIGTGAGFPGFPLQIYRQFVTNQAYELTLLDSLEKRIKFLKEVADHLELTNLEYLHGRAEDFGRNEAYREQYDLCVSRAVANLATLSEYCLPFVKVGGKFIAYKAGNSQEEIQEAKFAIGLLGGKITRVSEFKLPDSDMERVFVEITKLHSTKKIYPRKAGTPSKKPLGKKELL